MKTSIKRALCLFVSVLMLLSVFAVCTLAVEINPEDYVDYESTCSVTGDVHTGALKSVPIETEEGIFIYPPVNPNMQLLEDYSCRDPKEPTDTFYRLYYCNACGKHTKQIFTYENGKPKQQPHTHEILNYVEPTCSKTGLTEGEKCSVCGKILKEQKVINKVPHTDVDGDGLCDICKAQVWTPCVYCGGHHTGFFGSIVSFFHRIFYFFKTTILPMLGKLTTTTA